MIISGDIELLSPEPGSKDFRYLTNPDEAETMSARLGLAIGNRALRQNVANRYRNVDVFDREAAIDDYIGAFMPPNCLKCGSPPHAIRCAANAVDSGS